MRISFAILLIVAILTPVGCNSDLRCRRETALLRAEYLDLEDKYYSLLARSDDSAVLDGTPPNAPRYQNAVILDSGLPVSDGYEDGVILHSSQPVGSGVVIDQGVPSYPANQEIIYYDQSLGHQSSGEVIYGGVTGTASAPTPTPATPLLGGSTTRSGSAVEVSPTLQDIDSGEGRGLPENLLDGSEPLPTPDLPTQQSIIDEFDGISIVAPNSLGMKTELAASSQTAATVSKIQINPSVSRGENTDGITGDDGLKLLLQPMAYDGTVVEQAGNLTISVTDPAAEQGQQQVGYWEFVRSETELFFARDEFNNRGLLLNLPWNDGAPTNANLTVYVRYETESGNVIETTGSVTIDPPVSPLGYRGAEDSDDYATGDWYKGQARRRTYEQSTAEHSTFNTRPVSSQRDGEQYYSRPAWKPVR